ncbi:P-loop containing nucleoside triphosphate hydrolase protein [Serendipita vermifera]|nr:P-loop containing nucleoside triphosphate hydrolase protein [Serendipita vermifera]
MPLRPSVCIQCRISLQFPRLFHTSRQLERQWARTTKHDPFSPLAGHSRPSRRNGAFSEEAPYSKPRDRFSSSKKNEKKPLSVSQQREAILLQVRDWHTRRSTRQFLKTLGLDGDPAKKACALFQSTVKSELDNPDTFDADAWNWSNSQSHLDVNPTISIDRLLMKRFLKVMPTLDEELYGFLRTIDDALQLTHPAEWHPVARQVQRKIILHVGPTNSGKTYHALRALAAAKYGCYAGPLRLLATEIFGRLNRGEIAPTGADTSKRYPRVCNLVTGEDIKIVDEDAGLISATVEMVPLTRKFDVVVIDEIQMLANAERGNAWTQALVGLNAEEIHLCGEESAVELVKKLVEPMGDEVIINRYTRLTPLEMELHALGSYNLNKIKPGDCLIAFSRKQIFAWKHLIEEKSGLRCAVVYGKLPPEVRAEQAAKFNDTDEKTHQVLVASDAIGMGLNLKIKRVIFSTARKWNGHREVVLPLSEIKQIAGRAGRFGMHGKDSVGSVTSLLPFDHRIIAQALNTPVPELTSAILAPDHVTLTRLHRLLPTTPGLLQLFQLLMDLATCQEPFRLTDYAKLLDAAAVVDEACPTMTISTRATLAQAPVPWILPESGVIFRKMLQKFAEGEVVDAVKIFSDAGLLMILEDVGEAREEHLEKKRLKEEQAQNVEQSDSPSKKSNDQDRPVLNVGQASLRLEALEFLHRMTCVYLWLSYRFPVAFSMREKVQNMKLAAEAGIEFCLDMIQSDRARQLSMRLSKQEAQEMEMLEPPPPKSKPKPRSRHPWPQKNSPSEKGAAAAH